METLGRLLANTNDGDGGCLSGFSLNTASNASLRENGKLFIASSESPRNFNKFLHSFSGVLMFF